MGTEDIRRSQTRKQGYAKVLFIQESVPGYLRDFNSEGMKIELLEPVAWKTGDKKKAAIIPQEEIGIGKIAGTLEIRWQRKEDFYFSMGCRIISVKDASSQNNYKKLLKYFKSLEDEEH